MTHSNAAVITASGPYQPKPNSYQQYQQYQQQRGMGAPTGPMNEQQAYMLHRQQQLQQQQRMPVLSQQQQQMMSQEPMLPQQHMQAPQGSMVGPGPQGQLPLAASQQPEHPALAPAQPPAPQSTWNARDLRQLMEILKQEPEVREPQQGLPQALCHMGHHPVAGESANNNVTGGMATAP